MPGPGCGRSAGAAPELFALDDVDAEGLIYLDGNSLGALPKNRRRQGATRSCRRNGADGLIRSWNTAGWITLSQRIGDKIARLVGAGPGELTVADSTSVNLYKALSAAIALVAADAPAAAGSCRSAPTSRPTSTSPTRWPGRTASS